MAETNPLDTVAEIQRTWMEAWAMQSRAAFAMWTQIFDMQQNLLKQASAHHRSQVKIADGPSFTDKYGKRAHDIDPERDL